MKLIGALITLFTGLAISIIAGFISVYGMMQLFMAHAAIVGLMIGAIEVGKLVAATWLKFYWKDKVVPLLHKAYLVVAVLLTMVITSLGVFGFLSAGYSEQNAPSANLQAQVAPLELKIKQKESENEFLTKRLVQIDQNIGSFLNNDQASKGLSASKTLKGERDKIQKQLDQNNKDINTVNEQLLPLKMKSNDVEAKLGPVKYLTALLGWDDPEAAVRLVILLIMIPFDPLAVVLVLSGMITFTEWREQRGKEISINEEVSVPSEEIEDKFVENFIRNRGVLKDNPLNSEMLGEHPTKLELVDNIDIDCVAEAETSIPEERTREEILDILEKNPDIVNEIIATIVNDLDVTKDDSTGNIKSEIKVTPTDLTGGRAD